MPDAAPTSLLAAFYEQNPPTLDALSKPAWRQFRFANVDGRFFKVPDVIRTQKDLLPWLIRKIPLDVYYTVGRFLRPERLGPRSVVISENLFLGADLVFDIDHAPFCLESIDAARLDALRLVGWLTQANVSIRYAAFSGSKGFHVVCEDPFDYPEASPLEREKAAKAKRRIVADRVLEAGIPIDAKVTVDTRRILRLPGTVNSKTGYCCRVLSLNELEFSAEEILNKTKKVMGWSSPIRKEMTDSLQLFRNIVGLHRWEARSGPSFHYASFLSSDVVGTKLCVPLILFPVSVSLASAKATLQAAQRRFGLSDFFLFKSDRFFAVGIDALQPARVLKILRLAKSANASFFEKTHKVFVQISPSVDEAGKTVQPAPVFVARMVGSSLIKKVSWGHVRFLLDCGIELSDFQRKVGLEEYALSHALVES